METTKNGNKFVGFLKNMVSKQIFIPLAALLILLIFNLISDPSFFKIALDRNSAGDPVLTGHLISILDNGSELAILAIGMTLVTAATGGQDISVGATIAIAGSTMLRVICGSDAKADSVPFMLIVGGFLVACVVSMAFGAFNGTLVAVFKIQPMVATLILFTAGRNIAAWINNNQLPQVNDATFDTIGGFIPGIPVPTTIFITIICVAVAALVLKFTNLGLYVQSVGINEKSSRLNGINPTVIKFITFVILGLCVAVCALIKVSRASLNYSVIAKDIEMDAILAVALGGNALSGGKFNLWSSILGAYVIQFLTTTLYKLKVSSVALPAYKAVVVIILVVMSAPAVRAKIKEISNKIKAKKVKVEEVG